MRNNWQYITLKQADELEELGLTAPSEKIWSEHIERNTFYLENADCKLGNSKINAYNLSEIAVMLGYSFVSSNVKEAAERLIEELKNGASNAKDCNARLKEVQGA